MNKKNYISRNDLIIFNNEFNESLIDYVEIINKHKIIHFGIKFNLEISIIPDNISTIFFDNESKFNQEINNLNFNVNKIIFGDNFNKGLEYLHDGIEELVFTPTSIFNSDLSNLPNSLKKLTLGSNYNLQLNSLPSGLEYLKIDSLYNQEIKVFPPKLKYLFFYDLCKNVEYNNLYQIDIKEKYNFPIKNLPPNLFEIKYPQKYSHPIEKIPNTLKIIHISIHYKFIEDIEKNYPNIKIYEYN